MTYERAGSAMSASRNTMKLYFAVVGGALLIGLALFAPWQLWAPLALAALGTVLALLAKAAGRQPSRPSRPEPGFGHVPPTDIGRTRVTDVPLPTNLEDYSLLFSATILWSSTTLATDESVINPAALAVDTVLKRAREITELRDPSHTSLVRYELASVLGEMQADTTGRLRASAESVQLVLPELDQERLDKLSAVRKEEAIWEHERKYEQSKRAYLGGDVLKDPGSAVVWWLARNDDQVEKTVQDIGLLAQLSSAANNTDVPEAFQQLASAFAFPHAPNDAGDPSPNGSDPAWSPEREESAADRFETFLHAMRFDEFDPQRRLFARQVANWATMHGRQEIADELIRRYDPPNAAEPAGEADDGS